MGRALPCLLRIVAACPRSRLMRVCASLPRRSLDPGRSPTSNPVEEVHVPPAGPGTPQANGRIARRAPGWGARGQSEPGPDGGHLGSNGPGRDRPLGSGGQCPAYPVSPTHPPSLVRLAQVRAGARQQTASMEHSCRPSRIDAPSMLFQREPWELRRGPGGRTGGQVPRKRPDKQTHRWPLDGQSAPPGQRRDLACPATVA